MKKCGGLNLSQLFRKRRLNQLAVGYRQPLLEYIIILKKDAIGKQVNIATDKSTWHRIALVVF